ncbi:MAG: ubiquinol-cytochrome c reductase iron-sulfur subunit [Thermaceae bacterium]|nr:ubiquinol-cytochrome c reductase iron-sulfur subunit [Thermaceae bacterium]
MQKISRRKAIGVMALTGTGLALGQVALAQTTTPLKIADLSQLAKEWDSVPFEFNSTKSLLMRVPRPDQEDKRVQEVKQGDSTVYLSAYNLVCTHQGCTPNLPNTQHQLVCPCHGSTYNADGTVVRGPARLPLKGIKLEVKDAAVFAMGYLEG